MALRLKNDAEVAGYAIVQLPIGFPPLLGFLYRLSEDDNNYDDDDDDDNEHGSN